MSCDHEIRIPVGYAEQLDHQGYAIIENVIDFPVGEDCPFCPYWKGEQGSNSWL